MFNWLRLIWCACLALCAFPALAAQPPTAESYARPAVLGDVVISPSGKRLAFLVTGNDGLQRLAVLDLVPVGKPRVVGAVRDAHVTRAIWVNDERLVYEAFRAGSARYAEYDAGTFAVNHDGSDSLQLISWKNETTNGSNIASRVLPYGWFLDSAVGDGSSDVLLEYRERDTDGSLLRVRYSRLDTSTRRLRNLSLGLPAYATHALFDAKLNPRLAVVDRQGRTVLHWRAKVDGDWQQIADFESIKPEYTPLHIGADGEVLVSSSRDGTNGLYRLDPVTMKLDPNPLIKLKGFDLNPSLVTDARSKQLVGLRFVADRPMSYWMDEKLQGLQNALDKALPGRFNRIYCGACETTQYFVVMSSSDRQPAEYHLFDRTKGTLELIGSARPWLEESLQGERSFHRYAARDGLSVPIVVTHPPGVPRDQAAPAVVLVHGGPFVRGSNLRWEAESQFLASRGYRVLAPEFRGSRGFGTAHFHAGWKQWGRGMLTDLADAVQWAAKQGMIDPKRVCIVGSSYGGYAALMGPVATPEVYRCAASYAGVSDLELLYTYGWGDVSDESLRYFVPEMVGDPKDEKDRLAAESPLNRVAEFELPLLIGHGAEDQRVPIEHTRRFVSAAESRVKVEAVYYENEAHTLMLPRNQQDWLERLEAFLGKSLAARP